MTRSEIIEFQKEKFKEAKGVPDKDQGGFWFECSGCLADIIWYPFYGVGRWLCGCGEDD